MNQAAGGRMALAIASVLNSSGTWVGVIEGTRTSIGSQGVGPWRLSKDGNSELKPE